MCFGFNRSEGTDSSSDGKTHWLFPKNPVGFWQEAMRWAPCVSREAKGWKLKEEKSEGSSFSSQGGPPVSDRWDHLSVTSAAERKAGLSLHGDAEWFTKLGPKRDASFFLPTDFLHLKWPQPETTLLLFLLVLRLRLCLQNRTLSLWDFNMRITEIDEGLINLWHDAAQGYLKVSVLHWGETD